MQLSKLILGVFTASLIISCNKGDTKLESAIEQAGENKRELLKVIERYAKDPADSLKLKAAHYLIENMPGHFSYDTTSLFHYRPVVEKIHSLRTLGLSKDTIKERVNPLMDSLVSIYPLSCVYSTTEYDLNSIKSEFLIKTIEQSFEAYNRSPYKDSIQFDDFLEYLLPYRVKDGCCLEDWQSHFINNYSCDTTLSGKTVHQLVDSLLYYFKGIEFVEQVAKQYPYIKTADYLKSRMAGCPEKCWLNCMLLRSAGIPVTVDFVPVARIHESGHEWNTLKLKGGIYPFDAFGNDDIRYLKAFYGREKMHPKIGPIQFPKIYRKTFKMNISELLNHAIHSGVEIPPFFRNPFIQDVTDEYFKTYKLVAPLYKKIEDADYAYACVMGANQTWVPVDFGKIKKGKVLFNSMGTKNIYLPAYYKFGLLLPAAYPVLLDDNGSAKVLCPDTLHRREIKVSYVAYPRPELEPYKKSLIGCTLEGSNDKNFDHAKILYRFTESYEPGAYHLSIPENSKFRFFRLTLPSLAVHLNEIKFLIVDQGVEKEMKGKLICSYPKDSLYLRKIVDGDLLTSIYFQYISKEHKLMDKIWIGYDFTRPVSINAFEFFFSFSANIRKGGVYELLYWDFGWKSLGTKKSDSTSPVIFDHVPQNALLMIKIHDTDRYSRPFTYSNGEQHWW